ncbi:MAG TPA: cell division protein ZapA [bacterium]|nr:cell division protein ZapA [bacterium]
MCSDKNVLKVRIYGADYVIRGQADADYIKAIADYVDHRMREVDQSLRVDSSLKVAILAAVNIAHELFEERERLEDRLQHLNSLIDQQLKEK